MGVSVQVKNVGPIKDTGVISLNDVNLFIGEQSTGKSTLLKIITHCRAIENRALTGRRLEGIPVIEALTNNDRFAVELIRFFRFDPQFFNKESRIIYHGDYLDIEHTGDLTNVPSIKIKSSEGLLPKIVDFIPSERNLVSVVKDIENTYESSYDILFNFITKWMKYRDEYSFDNPLQLAVVPGIEYYYDDKLGARICLKNEGKELSTFYASSGIQSALPVEIMLNAVASKVGTEVKYTPWAKANLVNPAKIYGGFSLFVEELEQNLFPSAQAALLRRCIGVLNSVNSIYPHQSSLNITTHSPYVLTALNVLMAAARAAEKDLDSVRELVPEQFLIPVDSVTAHYLDRDGKCIDILEKDLDMVSGLELDKASTAVNDELNRIYEILG